MTDGRSGTSDLFQAIYTQRAIRRWRSDPVPDDLLWRIVEAATKAPSGSNSQPWRFLVVRDAGTRRKIAAALIAAVGSDSPIAKYFEEGSRSEDRSTRLMLTGALNILQDLDRAPVFVLPCLYTGDAPPSDRLRTGSSIYGAIQNLLLAARGLGVGGVLTTFDTYIQPQLRALLGIPENAQTAALVLLGLPDANFGPTRRRPVQEVTYWDRWDQVRPR